MKRQRLDRGTQYSYTSYPPLAGQTRVARDNLLQSDRAEIFRKARATTAEPLNAFCLAESYQQDYLTLYLDQSYIVVHELRENEQMQRLFPIDYQQSPVLVYAATAAQ